MYICVCVLLLLLLTCAFQLSSIQYCNRYDVTFITRIIIFTRRSYYYYSYPLCFSRRTSERFNNGNFPVSTKTHRHTFENGRIHRDEE